MQNFLKSVSKRIYRPGSVRRVWSGPIRGLKFRVAQGFGGSYAFGSEALHIRSLAQLAQPGATIYDIGANRGHVTMLFSSGVGQSGKVVAFEPVESLAKAIKDNLKLNGITNVDICGMALSDTCGTVQFEYSEHNSTQGKIIDVEPGLRVEGIEVIKVQTVRLDSYLEENPTVPPPSVMKIDVEGAGALVLKGARATIEKHRPMIFIELHGAEEQHAVQHELVENGYMAKSLDGRRVENVSVGWESPLILTGQSD